MTAPRAMPVSTSSCARPHRSAAAPPRWPAMASASGCSACRASAASTATSRSVTSPATRPAAARSPSSFWRHLPRNTALADARTDGLVGAGEAEVDGARRRVGPPGRDHLGAGVEADALGPVDLVVVQAHAGANVVDQRAPDEVPIAVARRTIDDDPRTLCGCALDVRPHALTVLRGDERPHHRAVVVTRADDDVGNTGRNR